MAAGSGTNVTGLPVFDDRIDVMHVNSKEILITDLQWIAVDPGRFGVAAASVGDHLAKVLSMAANITKHDRDHSGQFDKVVRNVLEASTPHNYFLPFKMYYIISA
jgi:hypothetical protein